VTQSVVESIDWKWYRKSVLLVIKEAVRLYSGSGALGKGDLPIQHLLFDYEAGEAAAFVPESDPGNAADVHGAIYQIAVWTYNQSACSGVCFETKAHAKQFNSESEVRLRQSGLEEMAQRRAQLEYNPSISDFLHNDFYLYEHPELLPLTQIDRFDDGQNYEAQRRIEEILLEAVREAMALRLFDALPREDQIWIGTSSARDPYDHIVKY